MYPATLSDILKIYQHTADARGLSPDTIRSTTYYVRTISRYIPYHTPLEDITEDVYYNMVIGMRGSGFKPGTIKTYSDCLRKLIHLAYLRGILKTNFFDHLYPTHFNRIDRADGLSTKLITKKEFQALQNCNDPCTAYHLLFSLLYYSGIRIGEALALSPSDIRACSGPDKRPALQVTINKTLIVNNGRPCIIHDTKNHKSRTILLPDVFSTRYERYMAEIKRLGDPLPADGRIFPVTYCSVYNTLLRCCKRAGIRRHTPHDFRHTYISNLISAGLPVSSAAYFSGDTEAVVLSTYVHVTEDYRSQLLDALKTF